MPQDTLLHKSPLTICAPLKARMSHPVKMNRLAKSARAKNAQLVAKLADDVGDMFFARVEANLGPKFRLVHFDPIKKRVVKVFGSPRGLFRSKKADMQFGVNDIVLISTSPAEGELCEMVGRIDRKDARPLYKAGHIHESIFASVDFFSAGKELKGASDGLDDLFDYGEDEDEELNIDSI